MQIKSFHLYPVTELYILEVRENTAAVYLEFLS